ncbi:hypothetical protein OIV83_006017 [Microbotryomycetes sp. JL201]|nr:hypothetical protein OIV83_006017 [Microbotryomycetes sp. JL201]
MISRPTARTLSRVLASSSRQFHATATGRQHILDASPERFTQAVSGSKTVLVDFYADWCGPCRALTPLLKQLVKPESEKFDLMTVNTDDQQELAMKYKIRALPTVVAFRNGEPVGQFTGALPAPRVQAFLEEISGR